jgi:hypothetical protein
VRIRQGGDGSDPEKSGLARREAAKPETKQIYRKYWHYADVLQRLLAGRYWVESGSRADIDKTSRLTDPVEKVAYLTVFPFSKDPNALINRRTSRLSRNAAA